MVGRTSEQTSPVGGSPVRFSSSSRAFLGWIRTAALRWTCCSNPDSKCQAQEDRMCMQPIVRQWFLCLFRQCLDQNKSDLNLVRQSVGPNPGLTYPYWVYKISSTTLSFHEALWERVIKKGAKLQIRSQRQGKGLTFRDWRGQRCSLQPWGLPLGSSGCSLHSTGTAGRCLGGSD